MKYQQHATAVHVIGIADLSNLAAFRLTFNILYDVNIYVFNEASSSEFERIPPH